MFSVGNVVNDDVPRWLHSLFLTMLTTILTRLGEWFEFRCKGAVLRTWTARGLISVKDLLVVLLGLLWAISLITSHSMLLVEMLILIDIFVGLHTLRFVVEARLVRAYRLVVLTFGRRQHAGIFRWVDYKLLIPEDHLVVTEWRVIIFWDVSRKILSFCSRCFQFAKVEFRNLWSFCCDKLSFASPMSLNCSCSFSSVMLRPSPSFLPGLLLRMDRLLGLSLSEFFCFEGCRFSQLLLWIEVRDESVGRLTIATTLIIPFHTAELVVKSSWELLPSLRQPA